MVRGLSSVEEAWNALQRQDFVPEPRPTRGPTRGFLSVLDDNLRISGNGELGPPLIAVPPTICACVTVAAIGREAMEVAEAASMAIFPMLARWMAVPFRKAPTRFAWDLIPVNGFVPASIASVTPGADFAAEAVLTHSDRLFVETSRIAEETNATIASLASARTGARFSGWRLAECHVWWKAAASLDLPMPRRLRNTQIFSPKELRKKSFGRLPDPYPALWSIWLSGVGLSACDFSSGYALCVPRASEETQG